MAFEQVLLFGGQAPAEKGEGTSTKIMERLSSDPDRPVKSEQAIVTKLTDEEVKKALTVLLIDYWAMSSWTYRGEVHLAFSCPYLSTDQRLDVVYSSTSIR